MCTIPADGNVQCEYMTAVINESLRLFPPAHVTTRTSKEDLTLAGKHVPAGTTGLEGMKPITVEVSYSADSCAFRPQLCVHSAPRFVIERHPANIG